MARSILDTIGKEYGTTMPAPRPAAPAAGRPTNTQAGRPSAPRPFVSAAPVQPNAAPTGRPPAPVTSPATSFASTFAKPAPGLAIAPPKTGGFTGYGVDPRAGGQIQRAVPAAQAPAVAAPQPQITAGPAAAPRPAPQPEVSGQPRNAVMRAAAAAPYAAPELPQINERFGRAEMGQDGRPRIRLNEEGHRAYQAIRERHEKAYGDWPGKDIAGSPRPPIVIGQPNFNPFRVQGGWGDEESN